MTAGRPIVVDCDTGIDDSLALLYLLASEEAEVLAITCCSGNVEAHQVADNNRGLLELIGRAEIEVALGRSVPLVRPLEITPETHGPRGVGYAELPAGRRPLSERHAADLFAEEARRRPGELTLLCIGPLTNLAVALEREPALPRLLRRLVIMGGAFRVPGNTTPVSEWNIHCDPDAARAVMHAWTAAIEADPSVSRILALGLDVTEQAVIRPDHVVALARRAGSRPDDSIALSRGEDPMRATRSVAGNPVVRFVADALRFYMEFHARYDGFYGAFIHDPLAAATALDESLVSTQALAVDVETGGDLTAGQTIADFRGLWDRPPNVDVAISADADEFLGRLIERVGALAERLGVAANPSNVAP
jgi:purine nucleosidase